MKELEAMFEKLESVTQEVNVDAVFGEPEQVGEYVLIPVAELAYGMGMGGGSAPSEKGAEETAEQAIEGASCDETPSGAGGGAGARARPIAYIEVGPEGTRVKAIMDEQKIALAGILLSAWAVGWLGLVLKTLFTRRS